MKQVRRLILSILSALPFASVRAKGPLPKEQMGRELRSMFLATPPEKMGLKPTTDFPRVFAVVLDWPVGEQIATVVSAADGTASLYTTASFGILGGQFHEAVRTAAQQFVHSAESLHDDAVPATDYPYPARGRVRFYLRTFAGLRVIEADAASIYSGRNRYSHLFALGQNVLTELRKVSSQASDR